jgi:ribosomal protein S18 acetylase RimI-like enzyme
MTISIRLLVDADLEAANAILRLAFQSPFSRLDELQLYRQMQPNRWFVASQGDHLVGMVGATSYGPFAHVGFMAIHPDSQRQGIGLALMQFLLADLDQQGIPLVVLDASEAGRPLYEKLGFVAYDETCLLRPPGDFAMPSPIPPVHKITVQDLDELVRLDTWFFGADRRRVFQVLLDAFPGRAFMQRDTDGRISGYLFAQRNRLGPWGMRQSQGAEALLEAALSLPFEEAPSLNVPSVNRDALELLQRYGYKQVRANLHMGRGAADPPGQRRNIYSQTSLAVG